MNIATLHYLAVIHRKTAARNGQNPYANMLLNMKQRLELIHGEYLRVYSQHPPRGGLLPLFRSNDLPSERIQQLVQIESSYQRDKQTLAQFDNLLRLLFKLPGHDGLSEDPKDERFPH